MGCTENLAAEAQTLSSLDPAARAQPCLSPSTFWSILIFKNYLSPQNAHTPLFTEREKRIKTISAETQT